MLHKAYSRNHQQVGERRLPPDAVAARRQGLRRHIRGAPPQGTGAAGMADGAADGEQLRLPRGRRRRLAQLLGSHRVRPRRQSQG